MLLGVDEKEFEIKQVSMPLKNIVDYTDNIYVLTRAIAENACNIHRKQPEEERKRYDHLQVSAKQIFDGDMQFSNES